MKKIISIVMALTVAVGMLCMPASAAKVNYIQDPSFEGDSRLWSDGSMAKDQSIAHTGEGYLSITTGWCFYYATDLKPNTKYTYSIWYQNQVAGDEVYYGVKDYGGKEILMGNTDNAGWTKYSVTFTTGADSTKATVYVGKNRGKGLTYFDDAELYEQEDLELFDASFNKETKSVSVKIKNTTESGKKTVLPICALYDANDKMLGWVMGGQTEVLAGKDVTFTDTLTTSAESFDGCYIMSYAWNTFAPPSPECSALKTEIN